MNNTAAEKVVTEKVVTPPSSKRDEYEVNIPVAFEAAAWGVTFAAVAYTATALVKLFSKD